MKTKRLPVGKRNLRVELEATSEGNRTATVGIDVSTIQFARSLFFFLNPPFSSTSFFSFLTNLYGLFGGAIFENRIGFGVKDVIISNGGDLSF